MITQSDLVTISLRDIGVLDSTEIPSADLMADGITTLNQILAQWQVMANFSYAQTDVTFVPTGVATYTVGTGGVINITPPSKIDYAFFRVSNIDYPIDILNTFEEYQLGIGLKNIGVGAYPECLYYNPSYPLGTIYLYPTPNFGVVHLGMSTQVISFPPQYELAIRFTLDEVLSATLGIPLRQDLAGIARNARRVIKRANIRINELNTDFETNSGLSNYGLMLRG